MRARIFTFFRFCTLLIIIQSAITFPSYSQFGNEWIKNDQTYYKIPVAETGFYAIPFADLRTAGIGIAPSGTIQPSELKIFHRGEEQTLLIRNDSLFFYGQRNDGTLDAFLYEPSEIQSNKNINLYSDTTAYFLTWTPGGMGKRMSVQSFGSTNITGDYHWEKKVLNFFDYYHSGYRYYSETFLSKWDTGEGWTSSGILGGSQKVFPIQCPDAYLNGPKAEIFVRMVGVNGTWNIVNNHNIQVLIHGGGLPDTTVSLPLFSYFESRDISIQIPAGYLSSGLVNVTVKNIGNGLPSNIVISHLTLTYPQSYQFSGTAIKTYKIPSINSLSNIQLPNCTAGTMLLDITNTNSVNVISSVYQSGKLNAVVNGSSVVLAVPEGKYNKPVSIKHVSIPVYTNVNSADYIIITHKKLINKVRDYGAYRVSQKGGGFDTLIAEVNNLYDMFSYGERTPLAIRRFITYLSQVGNPHYIFIIGKGLDVNYNTIGLYGVDAGPYYRLNPDYYVNNPDKTVNREDLIPPFGFPGSDLAYVAGLKGNLTDIPAIAIGRYAAQHEEDVDNYLKKVIEHEASPDAIWKKNFLHLSGGSDKAEKDSFFDFVNSLKSIAEDTIYSGKVVKTITKKTSGAIDNSLQSNIAEIVNNGVSHITSFGHTTPDFTDIDFGYASVDFYGYRNENKYPLLYTNGCYSGQIFGWNSFAEDWVKTPKRGAIATIGHTHVGYVNELMRYTTQFYKMSFDSREMIGKAIGDVQLKTIQNLSHNTLGPILIATMQQMTLHGDPAVKVHMPASTDVMIDDSRVTIHSYTGKPVTAVSDSFAIQLIVDNPGLDFNDSLEIKIRRTINGQITVYGPLKFKPVKYRDTILFNIRTPDIGTYGENIFEIYLDPNNSIEESNEMNNTATLRYFIPLSSVVTLFPKEFSIVNKTPVNFIAQATNLLTDEKDYYIEIDTSYLFNSFLKKSTTVKATSLIKWTDVSLPYLKDSTVYYWRIRYKDIGEGEDTLWGESSFIYIKDSPEGWSQSEFPQFFKDGTNHILRNIPVRKWEFSKNETPVYVKTVGNSFEIDNSDPTIPITPSMQTVVSIYGLVYTHRDYCYPGNGIIAVAFNRETGRPYTLQYGGYCEGVFGRPNMLNLFSGLSNPAVQNQLKMYIEAIPEGDAVLMLSTGQANFSDWDISLKELVKTSFGSDSILKLTNGRPFILLSVKGAAKPLREISIPDSPTSQIEMNDTIISTNRVGYISSTLIGPAEEWGTLYHDVIVSGTPGADSDSIMIIGVDANGNNADTLAISQKDSLNLSTITQLNNYRYIRLLKRMSDSVDLTPPYLRKWQVIYSGVPEGTMVTEKFGADMYKPFTTMEGDSTKFCYAFENISNYPFTDTLQARITITNSSKGSTVEWVKLSKLRTDSTTTFCYTLKTKGLPGNNILQVYVNPLIQKEQYYTNNILETPFTILKDQTNPVLDVVFDGVHIMNGDIVSPNPKIIITLNDENRFQIREDLAGIEVYIKYPGQTVPQKITTGLIGQQIGKNGRNSYQIEYNPADLPDGRYTLIVRASDVSGNLSGVQDYSVEFEVINESSITNFYPYPNPFSSNTRFVFTVTGNEVPKDIIIQIMTVTGKVVREITEQEIGPIKIGNNKTDYAWDGTDEFGDRLANGVYLYRVLIKNADTFKHRNTAGDKAFKKDWGKLYILR